LKVAIADVNETQLAQVAKELAALIGEGNVLVIPTDVSKLEQVQALSKRVYDAWGEVRVCATSRGLLPDAWYILLRFPLLSLIPSRCGTGAGPCAITFSAHHPIPAIPFPSYQ
jgi:hypothetical protein